MLKIPCLKAISLRAFSNIPMSRSGICVGMLKDLMSRFEGMHHRQPLVPLYLFAWPSLRSALSLSVSLRLHVKSENPDKILSWQFLARELVIVNSCTDYKRVPCSKCSRSFHVTLSQGMRPSTVPIAGRIQSIIPVLWCHLKTQFRMASPAKKYMNTLWSPLIF